MSEPGYLGPDSVAWKVHSDASSMVGGIRSLMVQTLEPRAMAAVAHHSVVRHDFWGRLQRTNDFLLTVVFGTRADADRAAAAVRAVHSRIEGFDHFSRSPYRADDPELLTWVQNATVESYLHAFRRHGRRLSQAQADAYVAEMRILGVLMGLSEADLPADEAGLRAYFDRRSAVMEASPDAKEAVRILLNPALPAQVKGLWVVPAADAFASLPGSYRRLLGIPYFPPVGIGTRLTTSVLLQTFRVLLPKPPLVEAALSRAA